MKQQCTRIVAIASPASVDMAGQVLVGSPATFFARIEPHYREVMVGGVLEKTSHMLILTEDFTLTEAQTRSAMIWLPPDASSDTTLARRAKGVNFCYGELGNLEQIEISL